MTLESATYINQLNSSYPEGTADRSSADDHTRLIKATIKATFPNVSGAMTATHAELSLMSGVTKTLSTFIPRISASVSALGTQVDALSSTVTAMKTSISALDTLVHSLSSCITAQNVEVARMSPLVGSASHSVIPNGGMMNLLPIAMCNAECNSFGVVTTSLVTSVLTHYNVLSITCSVDGAAGWATLSKAWSGTAAFCYAEVRRPTGLGNGKACTTLDATLDSPTQIKFHATDNWSSMSLTAATIHVFAYGINTTVKP